MSARTKYTKADRMPTWTSLVFDQLVRADDFRTIEQLAVAVKAPKRNVIFAALFHLKAHKAVESVVSEGKLWWFATPETDDRARQVLERAVEPTGTRKRRVTKGRIVK